MIYRYPLAAYFELGIQDTTELVLAPDIPLNVFRVACNAPAPGMFSISSRIMHEHDPFAPGGMIGNPFRCRLVSELNKESIKVEYSGYVPPGFPAGRRFQFTYHLIGHKADG